MPIAPFFNEESINLEESLSSLAGALDPSTEEQIEVETTSEVVSEEHGTECETCTKEGTNSNVNVTINGEPYSTPSSDKTEEESKIQEELEVESEIEEDIKRHQQKLIDLKEKSRNADEVIFKDAEYFQKKYKKKRISKVTGYSGYIVNGNNIIQWDSIYEASKLLSNFPESKVYTYPEKMNNITLLPWTNKTKYITDISKITQGEGILAYPNNNYYTLWINTKTHKPVCTEGVVTERITNNDKLAIPVTYQFDGITSGGDVIKCKVSDILSKKSTTKFKSDYSLVYGIPKYNQGVAIIYMNDTEPDKIQISKVTNDTKHILISPIGVTEFLGFIPLHSTIEYLFNLPEFVKGSYRYLSIKDIDSLIGDNQSNTNIIIGRKTKRNNICKEIIEL